MTYITDWALTIALLQELWQGLQQREQKLQSSIIIVETPPKKPHLARLICREQKSFGRNLPHFKDECLSFQSNAVVVLRVLCEMKVYRKPWVLMHVSMFIWLQKFRHVHWYLWY